MIIARTRDPRLVAMIARETGFGALDPAAWLADDRNIAFAAGDSVALFQWQGEGSWSVHWLFAARGRAALDLAAHAISAMFERHGARILWGIVPVGNRKSRLFARLLGCASRGIVDRPHGAGELFIMEREQWALSAT